MTFLTWVLSFAIIFQGAYVSGERVMYEAINESYEVGECAGEWVECYGQFYTFPERVYFSFNREYDLNGDGKSDSIAYGLAMQNNNKPIIYLKIGETLIYPNLVSPSIEFAIIDLDFEDNYYELVLYDDGPSDDPKFIFYRFINDEVVCIGEIEGHLFQYDGANKLYSEYNNLSYFEPEVVLGYWEYKNNRFNYIEADKEQFLGKCYLMGNPPMWNDEPIKIYKTPEGTKNQGNDQIATMNSYENIFLLDVGSSEDRNMAIKIRLENGTEGWIGHLFGGD